MITIITRWEDIQMPRELEHRMWRQLKGAFAVKNLIYVENDEEMKSAIDAAIGHLVFLEPTGVLSISDIPDGDITLVLGNTKTNNLKFAERRHETTYRINTPKPTDLYGINAAAIALAYRHKQ